MRLGVGFRALVLCPGNFVEDVREPSPCLCVIANPEDGLYNAVFASTGVWIHPNAWERSRGYSLHNVFVRQSFPHRVRGILVRAKECAREQGSKMGFQASRQGGEAYRKEDNGSQAVQAD